MPFINLIAEQREKKRASERKMRTWFYVFLSSFILGISLCGLLFIRTQMLIADARELQRDAEKLRPIIEQFEATKNALAQLNPRIKTLEKAVESTKRWNRIFNHFAYVTPTDTWLTALKSDAKQEKGKPLSVTFTGMSASQELIGELMLRLQQSFDLQSITLKYTDAKRIQVGEGLEFQIISTLQGTEESDTEEQSNKKEAAS